MKMALVAGVYCFFAVQLLLVGTVYGITYRVTWLAPSSSNQGLNASSSVGGLALALQKIQQNASILPGDNFTIQWKDSGCDSKLAIGAIYDVLASGYDPDVIIGPPCSSAMLRIADLASYRNLTVIGWFSNDPALTKKSQYTSLIRLFGSVDSIAPAVREVFDLFGWKRYTLVSSNITSTVYYQTAKGISDNLNVPSESNITYSRVRWPQDDPKEPKTPYINSVYDDVIKEARIVVLCVPPDDLRTWMLVAYDRGMAQGEYVFVYTNPSLPTEANAAYYTTDALWRRGDGRDSEAEQAFKSLLILIPMPTNVTAKQSFNQEAAAALTTTGLDGQLGITATTSDDYAPFLHDSLLMYATLLSEVGGSYRSGEAMRLKAANRVFLSKNSATSEVVMNENSDREPIFYLYNMDESGRFTPAYSFGYIVNGTNVDKEIKKIRDIRWADGSVGAENAPKDEPECGFKNEKCPTSLAVYIGPAVAVFVLIVGLVIGILVYRNYKYEQEVKSMGWKFEYNELTLGRGKKTGSEAFKALSQSTERVKSMASTLVSEDTMISQQQMFVTVGRLKGNVVAVKPVRKQAVKLDRDLLQEMQKIGGLKHTNLTTFLGACVDAPNICVVWEYCPKGSLPDVIWNENISLDDMFRFSLAIDILSGLVFLHDSSLKMHGRLKSTNCVIDGRWVCKLTDFGLVNLRADERDDPELSEHKRFSRAYWSPPEILQEWQEGQPIPLATPAADVYAVGVILKEIFARNGPYTEQEDEDLTSEEIIDKVRDSNGFRPSLEGLKCPDDLRKTIVSCWQTSPGERPSASSVLKDLKRTNPYKKLNVMDNMMQMMEKYAQRLEEIVRDRTVALQEEKVKSEVLLYRMLPKTVAEKLKRGDPVQAESFNVVTIYFSDILGFTDLAADSTPLQVVDFLNGVYSLFDEIIEGHDVYKVETVGDVYVLASGLPTKNGDRHIAEVANCAIDIQSGVLSFRVAHKPDYRMKIRIGIHTGAIVTGVVGLTMPRYCLFGDTINTASRMESHGAGRRIHLSPTAYDALSKFGGYHLADRGPIEVKGKGRMNTYWLVGKEGYERPLPDYDEVFGEDNPKPRRLPVTVGRVVRDRPSRVSTDSAFFESDGSRGPSRKTSAAENATGAAEPILIINDVIKEDEVRSDGDEAASGEDTALLQEDPAAAATVAGPSASDTAGPVSEESGDEVFHKVDTPKTNTPVIPRPKTATKLIDCEEEVFE